MQLILLYHTARVLSTSSVSDILTIYLMYAIIRDEGETLYRDFTDGEEVKQ